MTSPGNSRTKLAWSSSQSFLLLARGDMLHYDAGHKFPWVPEEFQHLSVAAEVVPLPAHAWELHIGLDHESYTIQHTWFSICRGSILYARGDYTTVIVARKFSSPQYAHPEHQTDMVTHASVLSRAVSFHTHRSQHFTG